MLWFRLCFISKRTYEEELKNIKEVKFRPKIFLLKLLRKHSVQHGKSTTSGRNNKDFVLEHQPEQNNSFIEDRTPKDSNNRVKYEAQTTDVQSTRPTSKFQKRSPVPRLKYKPILTGVESFNPGPFKRKEAVREPESIPEVKTEPEVKNEVFDESSDDETSDNEDTADEIDDSVEVIAVKNDDLSGMKLAELREVAKSRGIKGFSRLKKAELLELLTS